MAWTVRSHWLFCALLRKMAGPSLWATPYLVLAGSLLAEEPAPLPALNEPRAAATLAAPKPLGNDSPLPINLPTALQLAHVRPLDIDLASQRILAAAAQLKRARTLWLPTIYMGVDYARHDGRIQDTAGSLSDVSRGSFLAGAGPNAVFALTDAIFEPLAARQIVQSRQAGLVAATNDSLLSVAEAYFTVQEARGALAGAMNALTRSEDLLRRTEKLSPGLVPPFEVSRVRAELARRRQARDSAYEHWKLASADLNRLLRLDPKTLVDPLEPPELKIQLFSKDLVLDDLIPQALTARPELASQQAIVQAALRRLRAERLRPLVPSILLRGSSTPVTGTLAGGAFSGGRNDSLSNIGARSDFDIQVLWELQNLGFGNKARIEERRAEHQQSIVELFRLQDRIAAEVVQAQAQIQSAHVRLTEAEEGLKAAQNTVEKTFEGLAQTKNLGGEAFVPLIRPQEAVAAVQAVAQAYADYATALADFNRAQFRLYHALGNPANQVLDSNNSPCLPSVGMRTTIAEEPRIVPVSLEPPTVFASDR